MRSYYSGIIQAGKDVIYLNEHNAVCGLLKCLDESLWVQSAKTAQKPISKAREAQLTEKHHEQHRKRSELRRIAKAKQEDKPETPPEPQEVPVLRSKDFERMFRGWK